MATKRANVAQFPSPVKEAGKEAGESKFTYNVRSDGSESLTIRSNDEAEFVNLRTIYRSLIVKTDEPEDNYAREGDACTREGCKGEFKLKAGYSHKIGQDYKFLGCSQFPRCRETAIPIEEEAPAT
jgi:ssDNA-binding Zn-finger/Zn-ribbon topoisomerase 1